MSKSIHLAIPEPCHEAWDKMTQAEKGRFCQSCQKIVVDFSQMSDKQIVEYIGKASSQTCGHFYTDQLNRSLIETVEVRKSWWKKGWNMVAASFLFSTASYAQGNVTVKKPKLETIGKDKKCESKEIVVGRVATIPLNIKVLNSTTMEPIEGATVTTVKPDGSTESLVTNKGGLFKLDAIPEDQKFEISFTAIGYKLLKLPANYFNADRTIYLEQDYKELDTVVVTSLFYNTGRFTTGLTATVCARQDSLLDKFINAPVIRKIVDSFSMFSALKVYPNPAIAGSILNIQMDFSEKGPYKLELYNPIGQLVHLREIDVVKDQELVTLPLERNLSKGMYIVRINHQESKKRYTKKVIVN